MKALCLLLSIGFLCSCGEGMPLEPGLYSVDFRYPCGKITTIDWRVESEEGKEYRVFKPASPEVAAVGHYKKKEGLIRLRYVQDFNIESLPNCMAHNTIDVVLDPVNGGDEFTGVLKQTLQYCAVGTPATGVCDKCVWDPSETDVLGKRKGD